jgi:hypothetical protein
MRIRILDRFVGVGRGQSSAVRLAVGDVLRSAVLDEMGRFVDESAGLGKNAALMSMWVRG